MSCSDKSIDRSIDQSINQSVVDSDDEDVKDGCEIVSFYSKSAYKIGFRGVWSAGAYVGIYTAKR
jgi:hypothetical protein